jgi:ferredoxin
MNNPWILQTHGDPLLAIRRFLSHLWKRVRLDGLVAPQYQEKNDRVVPHLFDKPDDLAGADILAPMEILNTAKMVAALSRARPRGRYAALLRPCEMRALEALARRDGIRLDRWLTIGIDCLAAYPGEDYLWRAERAGGREKLTRELLTTAPQGGIAAYRFRASCQMCDDSHSTDADINIGLLGLPVRQYIFVTAGKSPLAHQVGLCALTHDPATQEQIDHREKILHRLEHVHRKARLRITETLTPEQPRSVAELIAMFAGCAPCRACLDNCPVYLDELAPLRTGGNVSTEAVTRWVAFCAQCGVCQENCPKGWPIATIMGRIRQNLNLANPSLAI